MPKRPRSRKRAKRGSVNKIRLYSTQPDRLEQALASGEDAQWLESYFGEETYRELHRLAQEAERRRRRGGPRVLILPGIMGSTIGEPGTLLDDIIWLDPVDIGLGNLVELALTSSKSSYRSLGVIPIAYTLLKLRLVSAGYDADYHHFDWRQSIDKLGDELIRRLKQERAQEVHLVAHSMGGLVSRSAIAQKAPKIKQLIMLGTPNHGSFVPVQAIRAVYPVVRQIAAIDPFHSAEELSTRVFTTFPGLYQMLPTEEKFSTLDLYDLGIWPQQEPRPRGKVLAKAQPVQQSLAKADDRFFLIAGVNQDTVTNLRKDQDEFIYEQTNEGDSTVPLVFCRLDGAKTYYVEESHGSLPNNRLVGQAVIDLLASGKTNVLPDQWTRVRREVGREMRDSELRVPEFEGRRGPNQLSQREIRKVLEPLVSAEAHEPSTAVKSLAQEVSGITSPYGHRFDHVVVGRRRQHRIDFRLALGSITEVDARACVLGVFRDVVPSGAAIALDSRVGGAIGDFTRRRMFSGNIGEMFMMPTGRHPLRADTIILAGLGHFDQFNQEVLQLTAENVIRTCIRTNVEECATVLFGAGSGQPTSVALKSLLTGFFRGLRDADSDHNFRRITLCEMDLTRYEEIKEELFRLSSTDLFHEVEVTFDEIKLPEPPQLAPPTRGIVAEPDPIYLIVRDESLPNKGNIILRASVLTAGGKATVISDTQVISPAALAGHLQKLTRIGTSSFTLDSLNQFGDELSKLVLPDRVATALRAIPNRHLVVVHDEKASRIPWETLRIGDWCPGSDRGVSRNYLADNLSVAKWLEQRQFGTTLDVLLVVNPTLDLSGAEREGDRLHKLFSGQPSIKIHEVRGALATKNALLTKFRSGEYDVVHYAGHAFFDSKNPSRSGIRCHQGEVLSGADLASVGNLPALVFFNACEAGRIRGARGKKDKPKNIDQRLAENVSLAEAFLRGGVANYVGTYWPVGDDSAAAFAEVFYTELLRGKTIGSALQTGRTKVMQDVKSVDWADYLLYGSTGFVLKQPS
jgi:pimeloyl-ACP methyl ester carboxylesterase